MKDDRPALTDDHEPPPPPDFEPFHDPEIDREWAEFIEEERKLCETRKVDKVFRFRGFFEEE